MADPNHEIIAVLNDLIETCKDGERGFREAAENVKSDELKRLFLTYSEQRKQFVVDLEAEVRRLGGDPDKSSSVGATLHRGWMNLRQAISEENEEAIIAEAERGEDVAVKKFEEAMNGNLPADVESIISRQYAEAREAHDRVRALEKASTRE